MAKQLNKSDKNTQNFQFLIKNVASKHFCIVSQTETFYFSHEFLLFMNVMTNIKAISQSLKLSLVVYSTVNMSKTHMKSSLIGRLRYLPNVGIGSEPPVTSKVKYGI